MTSKEALEDLIKRNEYFKKNGVHIGTKTIDKIRELVERDTPMKVKHENNGIPYCSVCERSYLRDVRGNKNRFCGYCGKRLDWS